MAATPLAPSRPMAVRPARRRAGRVEAAAFVVPALLPVLALSVAPLLIAIGLSFTGARLVRHPDYSLVGLENYARLADAPAFWDSFGIGMVWGLAVTVLQLAAGMGLALLLNSDLRFGALTKVLALIPWAMPPVVVAIMWQLILSYTGPVNATLTSLGLSADRNWLMDSTWALPCAILVGVWIGMPQTTVTLLAGLQQIPGELHEAAALDGAGAWRRFWSVSVPSITPVIGSIASLNFIWNFNSFSLVYVLTEGGPGGRTMLPMLYVYNKAFGSRDIAEAAAMGVVLMLVVVGLLVAYLRVQLRGQDS